MKTILQLKYIILLSAIVSLLASCHKDVTVTTPHPPSNEFLTTVVLKLVNPNNAADTATAIWRQLDPTGSAPPDTSKAILNIHANVSYVAKVLILDETKTPVDSVTPEIQTRENYHLLFFQPTPISANNLVISTTTTNIPGTTTSATGPYLNLVVTRTDQDANTPPMQIGLHDIFATGAASTGRLRVVLRHQPNVKNGTYPPGSSDFDINYTVNIQ